VLESGSGKNRPTEFDVANHLRAEPSTNELGLPRVGTPAVVVPRGGGVIEGQGEVQQKPAGQSGRAGDKA
jgi:hypothetical protein